MRAPISGEAATPPFRTPARSVAVWSLHSSRAVTSPMGPDAAGWACRCQCDWPSLRSAGAGGWCMSSSDRGSGLYGRGGQCDLLDRLLAATQAGESQVLVVRGEAGIGKTALLDYVAQRASGCSVPSCSSARTRSSGTCARCSPSSGSVAQTAPFHAGRRCHCLVAGCGTLRLLGTRVHVLAASATSRAAETNDSTVGLVSPGRRASDTTAGSASVTGR